MRTTFPEENGENGLCDTKTTQETPSSEPEPANDNVRFPRIVENKKAKVAVTIYGKSKAFPAYRLVWHAPGGKRLTKRFRTYSEAKTAADTKLGELAKGSQAAALSSKQATDALAALDRLQSHYEATGRRLSILAAVSQFCDMDALLDGATTPREAVEGYRRNIAAVQRMDLGKAVEDFIAAEEKRTKAVDGKRPELNPKYHYNRAIMLRRFSGSFTGTAVCDLSKQLLDAFFSSLGKLKSKSRNHKPIKSAKSRNHHRAAVRQFLAWAVRKDYLAANHRLIEADGLRPENGNTAEIEFYTAKEFGDLLSKAGGMAIRQGRSKIPDTMQALIAIGGLAGLRTAELLRLDWQDVWRVDGHIEITSGKAKTRQRRLVEIVPTLAQWLGTFRKFKQGRIWAQAEVTWQQTFCDVCEAAKVPRKPNGLRHSFCTYGYALNGEVWTAQQAGHDVRMLHANYRGLARKSEAQQWFSVAPEMADNVVQLTQDRGEKKA